MIAKNKMTYTHSSLSNDDIFLFNEGTHFQLYRHLGAHPVTRDQEIGVHFAVWAPNAEAVSVIGDFNSWQPGSHPLQQIHSGSGIWEGMIPGLETGEKYKYHLQSRYQQYAVDKQDPYGFYGEIPPLTASVVWNLDYQWQDESWMKQRLQKNQLDQPFSVYEVHLGSWRRKTEPENAFLSYRELAAELADYCRENGFTHVHRLEGNFGAWDMVSFIDIDAMQAKSNMDAGDFEAIFDVSPVFNSGHLPGATNANAGGGGTALSDLIDGIDQTKSYLVYCHSDGPAMAGAQLMEDAGFENVYRLEGNYGAWVDAGFAVE